jgi:hypothetical protein
MIGLRCRNAALEQRIAEQRGMGERLEGEKLALQQSLTTLRDQNRLLLKRIDELQAIETSTTWRATSRLRAAASRLPPPVRRRLLRAAKAGYWALTPHKIPARIKLLRERQRAEAIAGADGVSHPYDGTADYAIWIRQYDTLTEDDRRAIGEAIGRLVDPPLISVVMPVYGTGTVPACRHRLGADTALSGWELCTPMMRRNHRMSGACSRNIGYRRLHKICYRSENGHIWKRATAPWRWPKASSRFDHDDQPPSTLYDRSDARRAAELDLIFSDEDKIDTRAALRSVFQIGWNPDLMLSQNTFSHLGVIAQPH